MDILEKRKEISALIDNIKEHSDRLEDIEHLPLLELSVILSKITKLHENTLILKYLIAVDQHHEDREFGVDKTLLDEELKEKKEETIQEESEEQGGQEDITKTVERETEKEGWLNEIIEASKIAEDFSGTKEKEDSQSIEESILPIEDETKRELEESKKKLDLTNNLNIVEEGEEEENNRIEKEISIEEIEQKTEIDSKPDLNEVFSEEETPSLSEQLNKQPIADLLTAIGLNERYLYANELFDGDIEDFRKVIGILNDFETKEEAVDFFNNDLRQNYNWEKNNEIAEALFSLVERRFQA